MTNFGKWIGASLFATALAVPVLADDFEFDLDIDIDSDRAVYYDGPRYVHYSRPVYYSSCYRPVVVRPYCGPRVVYYDHYRPAYRTTYVHSYSRPVYVNRGYSRVHYGGPRYYHGGSGVRVSVRR